MNGEKKRYMIQKFVTAAVALVILAVVLFLLLRPVAPTGVYENRELKSSIEFGEDLSVTYRTESRVYTGTAINRSGIYRCAVSDGTRDIILEISVYKGYIEVSSENLFERAVFSR